MTDSSDKNAPARAGLDAVHLATQVRAELIGAVIRARRNLQDQQEIAQETVARFKRRVARAEADARGAGIDLTTVAD